MNTELLFSDLGGDDAFDHRNASAVSLQQNTKTNSESIFCDEKLADLGTPFSDQYTGHRVNSIAGSMPHHHHHEIPHLPSLTELQGRQYRAKAKPADTRLPIAFGQPSQIDSCNNLHVLVSPIAKSKASYSPPMSFPQHPQTNPDRKRKRATIDVESFHSNEDIHITAHRKDEIEENVKERERERERENKTIKEAEKHKEMEGSFESIAKERELEGSIEREQEREIDRERERNKQDTSTHQNMGPSSPDINSRASATFQQRTQSELIELMKDNIQLRKKNTTLMKHNMRLILELKEKEHRLFKQDLILTKYRKKLVQLFEAQSSTLSIPSLKHKAVYDTDSTYPSEMDDEDEGDEDMYAEEELEDDLDESNEYQEKGKEKDKLFGGPSRLEYKEPYREANLHAPPKRGCKQTSETTISGFGAQPLETRRRKGRRSTLWSPEDEEKFVQAYHLHGKSWKAIHDSFPNKTREQVQSHGQYLIRTGKIEDLPKPRKRNKTETAAKDNSEGTSSYSLLDKHACIW